MDLVLSIVERYLIQCPFLGVSVKRDSTEQDLERNTNKIKHSNLRVSEWSK